MIVCSARSGSTKALGTTNLLLRAASEALKPFRQPGTPGFQTPAWGSAWGSAPSSPGPRLEMLSSLSPQQFTPLNLPLDGSPSSTSRKSDGITSAYIPPNYQQPSFSFSETVELIRSEHITAARLAIRSTTILRELESEFERDCDGLRNFLFAAQVS